MVHTVNLAASTLRLYKRKISGMSKVWRLCRGRRILYVVTKHFNTNLMGWCLNNLRKYIVLPLKSLSVFFRVVLNIFVYCCTKILFNLLICSKHYSPQQWFVSAVGRIWPFRFYLWGKLRGWTKAERQEQVPVNILKFNFIILVQLSCFLV